MTVPISVMMESMRSMLAYGKADSKLRAAVYRAVRYLLRDPAIVDIFRQLVSETFAKGVTRP